MTWDNAIAEYTTAMRAARRSPGTVRLHRHYLRRLAGQVGSPWTVTTPQLRTYLDVSHWSAETQKSARASVVAFYRWAHAAGHVDEDPAAALAPITVPAGVPRPAPETALRKALARADHRERVMLLLAAYAGLRCAEIAQVHTDDLTEGLLYVTGKGGKTRIVPLEHPELLAAFARAAGYLFPGKVDGHLSPGYVTKLLSEVLPDGWTGHTLRHRFATRSYARNSDAFALGKVLGHSRPETTLRYVQVPTEALMRVVRGAA
jgi:integrase/recombinase XerC